MKKNIKNIIHNSVYFRRVFLIKIVLFIVLCVGIWNVWKPLPENINKKWGQRNVNESQVAFLQDTTYFTSEGERKVDQHIFNEVIGMVRNAHSYILVDMFLWNDYLGGSTTTQRKIAQELATELILKKKENPNIVIEVISDPINISYYGGVSDIFENMKKSGIDVTFTNLSKLRDSNPLFSSFWRVFVNSLDMLHVYLFNSYYTFRIFPNIINAGGEPVTLRSFLSLLNFKANHRKLIVTDEFREGGIHYVSLVASANPHDGSSSHSNVAIKIDGDIAKDIILSENQILNLSGKSTKAQTLDNVAPSGDIKVALVTDGAIKDEVISLIRNTQKGDSINLLMFYISDRDIIRELVDAAKRDVSVHIILDPNKDAFGREKNGIPNRETADSLVKKSSNKIVIRWCDTHGEQCHGKMLLVKQKDTHSVLLGSANYTRRNIGGYNLETDILVTSKNVFTAWNDSSEYFSKLWNNENMLFTTEYTVYKDESVFKKIISWIMENSGVGTF
ncbi:MAG: DUF1669 domain-containing protein [Candidatus Pacebacteria bacterium]|nr:DUF1669 domain-containing protein [Candidatus Paceibacterota bacterium]MBP9866760.1 DUF1669 domain-containing protein [Candidatus Paceibacterota bacterium]